MLSLLLTKKENIANEKMVCFFLKDGGVSVREEKFDNEYE